MDRLIRIGLVIFLLLAVEAFAGWGDPVNMGPMINTSSAERSPRLSFDSRTLYFMRSGDIWYSTWDDTGWTEAVNIGPPINTLYYNEEDPMPSPDGMSLYFTSDRPGGLGDLDIWVSHYDSVGGQWGEPEVLGPPIGTEDTEKVPTLTGDGLSLYMYAAGPPYPGPFYVSHRNGSGWGEKIDLLIYSHIGPTDYPAISADGLTLYFHLSEYPVGLRIYFCYKTGEHDTSWSQEQRLEGPVNDDLAAAPFISADGSRLFLVSNRPGSYGSTDIWYSDWETSVDDSESNEKVTAKDPIILTINPNPFNSSCKIVVENLKSDKRENVSVRIYNLLGQLVKGWQISAKDTSAQLTWNGEDKEGVLLPSGVYFCKVRSSGKEIIQKVTILR